MSAQKSHTKICEKYEKIKYGQKFRRKIIFFKQKIKVETKCVRKYKTKKKHFFSFCKLIKSDLKIKKLVFRNRKFSDF